ncbi:MAG: protein-L-isoaspartate(D-aspartate) O-methyltransferase [Rhodobacteraceae bacterium]|nr:protein-L-isoaspartate(D-aspartate) O-methyltransferase [Paracoccaceae bacterium]
MEPSDETRMQFLFSLRSHGVTDKKVLAAMEKVDRGKFVQGLFASRAYEDRPLPIPCGQTISQPSVVGLMTQALEVRPRSKVLEIGTGSGYQAAILSLLARRVYSVERHRELAQSARRVLDDLGMVNVTVMTADGSLGLPDQAPFDRILLTAAPEDPPANLLAQLSPGGIMVLPVGQSDSVQSLIKAQKTADGVTYTELCEVRFVPLVEGLA